MNRSFTLSFVLLVGGCFTDVVPDGDRGASTEQDEVTPPVPVEATSSGETSSDDTSGDATSGGDDEPMCGDGIRDPEEACDDGNLEPGDGCDANCQKEPRACASGVTTLGEDLERGIGVCKDPSNATCEMDFATLCAPGWHLCSGTEHVQLNDGMIIELGDISAVGVIRCRSQGGSGHYTSHDFNIDGPDSCEIGSSRADCPTNLGCNEGIHAALCCAPILSCGNGVIDDPLEECDDGNDDDFDACSSACANRTGSGPHC
jgi:cysteine-rich repeat protein